MPSFLVSGTGSGLGRYLHRRFGGDAVTRGTAIDELQRHADGYDVIVHCAATAATDAALADPRAFFNDNLFLTERLLAVPHRCFVYLSSVDVYPRHAAIRREDITTAVEDAVGPYAACKLISEGLVRRLSSGPLILRPTSLVGADARPSNLVRLLTEPRPSLTVSGRSRYNAVLHRDVGDFIEACLAAGTRGTFNLASSDTVHVKDIAAHFGREASFGDHLYDVGEVDNAKARAVLPALGRPTLETLQRFLRGEA